MIDRIAEYYRCPEHYLRFALNEAQVQSSSPLSASSSVNKADYPLRDLCAAFQDARIENGRAYLPFDFMQIIDGLRNESYTRSSQSSSLSKEAIRRIYYFLRPALPVSVRKHLQKLHLKGWQNIPFPRWPVDSTVDDLFEQLMLLSLKANRVKRIPFIWFWPDGASSCAVLTHDVETTLGRDFSATVMDIDDKFGLKASFYVVPERRYEVPASYLDSITKRGFEVGVQDLNHDGHLYQDRQQFIERVAKINAYGRQWGASGFRAAVLYRRQEWFADLDFAYDMSVPNVAHLEPQQGGCCTVMPYFVGKVLELPVTATQDYSLFHILNDYSIDLWKRQIELIMGKHGLIAFIIHPDYITGSRERQTYEELLSHLGWLRKEKGVWIPTAGDVNLWWRQRAEMSVVEEGGKIRIEGVGKERARIAYASEENGRLQFSLETTNETVAESLAVGRSRPMSWGVS
jgi:hypothetical protein